MSQIQIYARVRPTTRPFKGLKVQLEDNTVTIGIGNQDDISKRPESRYSRAPPSSHTFQFSQVFDQSATQEEVFDRVALHMIGSFLSGYNGTIFAYGQTSSGKTHTIEGSSRRFADRGLIPRTISAVYQEVERRCGLGQDMTVEVSYMEIYQDTGYDLLNPGMRPGALMVTLPKVHITEGPSGEVNVRNLSMHLAASEDVAMSLLFQGSTCRKVAETSMNQCSSRSHSIFTLYLTAKSPGKEVIVRSKLNLVDLAGSERVAKTRADGRILREAKHINLSLHHLEHVIVSLQQLSRQGSSPNVSRQHTSSGRNRTSRASPAGGNRSQRKTPPSPQSNEIPKSPSTHGGRAGLHGHIPYRNSMLTMVLRDSLGGNCLTAMIATISAEEGNVWESISTCRFSQRVACISNTARRNEELDDKVVIKRLRLRVAELEQEIVLLKKGTVGQEAIITQDENSFVSPEDQKHCHKILYLFFHGKISNPVQAGINSSAKFRECMQVMKKIVLQALDIKANRKMEENTEQAQPILQEPPAPPAPMQNSETNKSPSTGRFTGGKDSEPVYNQHLELVEEATPAHFVESRQRLVNAASESNATVKTAKSNKSLKPLTMKEHLKTVADSYAPPLDSLDSELPLLPQKKRTSVKIATTRSKILQSRKKKTGEGRGSNTSSQTSRLSSGFGSMQDEGSCVTLQDEEISPRGRQAVLQDEWTARNGSTKHAGRQSQHHRHYEKVSHDFEGNFSSIGRPLDNTNNIQKTNSPILAWTTPDPVQRPPESQSVSTSSTTTDSVRSSTTPANHGAEEWRAQAVLVEKQEALQHAKRLEQRLAKNVKLLNLKVAEEKLVGELNAAREKLAGQHALVKSLEKDEDEMIIAAERIAEQQLYSKQEKLYHKLQSVQQHIKSIVADVEAEVTSSESLPSTSCSGTVSALSPTTKATSPSTISPIKPVPTIGPVLSLTEAVPSLSVRPNPPLKFPENGGHSRSSGRNTTATLQVSSPPSHVPSESGTGQSRTSGRSTRMSGTTLQASRDITRQQHQVENEIEKLKYLQAEKQLQLREAATRRKIQALKDQLAGDGATHTHISDHNTQSATLRHHPETVVPSAHMTALKRHVTSPPAPKDHVTSTATSKTSIHTPKNISADTHTNHVNFSNAHTTIMVSPRTHVTSNISQATFTITSPTSPTSCDQLSASNSGSSHTASSRSHLSPVSSQTTPTTGHMMPPPPRPVEKSPASTGHMTRPPPRPVEKSPAPTGHMMPPPPRPVEKSPVSSQAGPMGHMTSSPRPVDQSPVSSQTGPTSHMTPPPRPVEKKLTVPAEVKETEYMTEVQRQRARVARIRRCITAATVIQRAWRQFRDSHRLHGWRHN